MYMVANTANQKLCIVSLPHFSDFSDQFCPSSNNTFVLPEMIDRSLIIMNKNNEYNVYKIMDNQFDAEIFSTANLLGNISDYLQAPILARGYDTASGKFWILSSVGSIRYIFYDFSTNDIDFEPSVPNLRIEADYAISGERSVVGMNPDKWTRIDISGEISKLRVTVASNAPYRGKAFFSQRRESLAYLLQYMGDGSMYLLKGDFESHRDIDRGLQFPSIQWPDGAQLDKACCEVEPAVWDPDTYIMNWVIPAEDGTYWMTFHFKVTDDEVIVSSNPVKRKINWSVVVPEYVSISDCRVLEDEVNFKFIAVGVIEAKGKSYGYLLHPPQ